MATMASATVTSRVLPFLLAASAACGGAKPADAPPRAAEPSAPAASTSTISPAPVATPSAPSPPALPQASPTPTHFGLKATTAMPIAGQFDPEAMLEEINGQIDEASRCADIIRESDSVVGSLNVELTIANGRVTPDLQSPTNDRGRICLLKAMSAWRLHAVGRGKSMLLLTFVDGVGGPP